MSTEVAAGMIFKAMHARGWRFVTDINPAITHEIEGSTCIVTFSASCRIEQWGVPRTTDDFKAEVERVVEHYRVLLRILDDIRKDKAQGAEAPRCTSADRDDINNLE